MITLFAALALAGPLEGAPPAAPIRIEAGVDRGLGNVITVQPWLTPADFLTADAWQAALGGVIGEAAEAGWLRPDTVVVLPEYVGTWLVAVDERPRVARARTTKKAMTRVVLSHLGDWRRAKREAPADDAATYGVFAMKAPAMAATYQDVLGALARRFAVTLVGGSILLPEPSIVDGRLVAGPAGAPLQNVSVVFGPDGRIVGPPTRKVHLTADEAPFLGAARLADLPVHQTAAGRLGVLVCADAWFPRSWEALEGADVVVVPQYTAGIGTWGAPWGGYSGQAAPGDVEQAHVGTLTEADAWAAYAVPGRAGEAQTAVTAPLRGELWDLGTDGQIRWRSPQGEGEGPLVDRAVVLAVWR